MTSVADATAVVEDYYPDLIPLVESVRERSEGLATGDYQIRDSALRAEKFAFDHAISHESLAKPYINALLKTLQNYEAAPQTRSQTKAALENSGPKPPPPALPPFESTPLDSLFLDGMNSDQIWEQLELKTKNLLKVLDSIVAPDEDPDAASDESSDFDVKDARAVVGADDDDDDDEDGMDLDMDDIGNYDDIDSEEDDDEDFDEDEEGLELDDDLDFEDDGEEGDEDESSEGEETIAPLRGEGIPDLDLDRPRGGRSLAASRRPSHPTLDDAFFSIDDFNRETEALESKTRSSGSLDADDEDATEDVDLFAAVDDAPQAFEEDDEEDMSSFSIDPSYKDFFAPPPRPPPSSSKKRPHSDPSSSSSAGPSSSASAKKAKLDSTSSESSTIPKKRGVSFSDNVRVRTIAARKNTAKERLELYRRMGMAKGIPGEVLDSATFEEVSEEDDGEDDDDGDDDDDDEGEEVDWDMDRFDDVDGLDEDAYLDEDENEDDDDLDSESDPDLDDPSEVGVETIQRLKSDLFDDEESVDNDPAAAKSAHAKRQAALAEEIASFEAENVGQKDWTLMGEATSRSRPKNSLLEEDLDFERQGGARAAPVMTEEATKTLEDMIKARIVDGRYDDVVRKRVVEDDKAFLPSRMFELDGSKSSRSLAQLYEDEFAATRDGTGVVDDRDGKLAKEHEELDKLWNAICYKLDALSNAHFTPKAPSAEITTISNVATTSLESALPTTSSTSTLLAPEEVLAPSKSDPRDRSELTPGEKRSARSKERKKRKKASDAIKSYVASRPGGGGRRNKTASEKKEKDEALRTLVKSGKGVTVVGKESANAKRAPTGITNGKGAKQGQAARRGEDKVPNGVTGAGLKL
ncbi:Mpp10 protein [Clavulina sp. PMI_390]|nr:Mpp10 protein [Clavulina sp. PMI_390]